MPIENYTTDLFCEISLQQLDDILLSCPFESQEDEECGICMSSLRENRIIMLQCFHVYHQHCIVQDVNHHFRNWQQHLTNQPWRYSCPKRDNRNSLSEHGRCILYNFGMNNVQSNNINLLIVP